MSQLIGIIGDQGTGKSTSIETLDPKSTFIINVTGKPLPFRGSGKMYSEENKNYKQTDKAGDIVSLLKLINEKALHIKTVVIEDGQYIMAFEFMRRSKEAGYSKFSDLGKDMTSIFDAAKSLREDLIVVYTSHSEDVVDNGSISKLKMKTIGAMLDNYINLEGLFTICLYTHFETSKDNKMNYCFVTNRWEKYPAKSPRGMFSEIKIPNDLAYVIREVESYYKG